ncbi:zinc ribbon domain-containing protein [Mycolicibacterium aubagnense]|uniref:zinc ribbon domain-containing protein n=1 Tax=Mycolicibacterium aubagnense TaxID=319707 RepID=UPI0010FEC2AA|nr:zinc ribbon domain-containing protein [Mycolicibacterium aubagnense]
MLLALAGATGILFGALMIPFTSGGWFLIAAAASIASSALWVSRGRADLAVLPVAVCVFVSVQIVYGIALEGRSWRNWSFADKPLVVAGAALVVALIGSLLLCKRPSAAGERSAERATDGCPKCTRMVAAGARLCGYCGFAVGRYRSGS